MRIFTPNCNFGEIYKLTTTGLHRNKTLDDHIINRAVECLRYMPITTIDTEGTERNLVSFTMFSKEGDVTFLWTGGDVEDRFLALLNRWVVDVECEWGVDAECDIAYIFTSTGSWRSA